MSSSINHNLPRTQKIDVNIRKHFANMCNLYDRLEEIKRNGTAASAAMASTPSKKRASTGAMKLEASASPSSLHAEFVVHCKKLGELLGKRLFKKYSGVLTSRLIGNDGYAILNLLPTPCEFFTSEHKKHLLRFFWLEIEPHLCPIEAIMPTFCQVNMRKLQETFLDHPDAAPLTSSFFTALNGTSETLFPLHTFRSLQLLQTSVGVPVQLPPGTETNCHELEKIFGHNAPVSLERRQSVQKKRALVGNRFLEPVPHLDYDAEQLTAIQSAYGNDESKIPCFFELPFESTIGLNVFGRDAYPQMDAEEKHYLGKRINVEVGQLLVVSPYLWHATALPCPVYSRVWNAAQGASSPHFVTQSDNRLHIYLGCNELDVDDMNLCLPPGEKGMQPTNSPYHIAEVPSLSNDKVVSHSRTVFKSEQIKK